MPNGKLKKFLFPNEDEHLSEMMSNERASFQTRAKQAPEVEDDDGDLSFTETLKQPQLEQKAAQLRKDNISEALVYAPNTFTDSEKIAKELIKGNPLIINLENLLRSETEAGSATRVIDFLCGVAYALKSEVKRINNSTFIFTPQQQGRQVTLRDEIRFK